MRASDAHHHLASSNLIHLEQLEKLFKSGAQSQSSVDGDMVGERYKQLIEELSCITEYQWRAPVQRGLIKGFMLSGPPGTGKTTLAKRLAFEMCERFKEPEGEPVVMAFIDGGEISRSRYGESEERIRDIFVHARAGFTEVGQRSVLLFDDVESIFMARSSQHAKEWHFSQDSVFFHAVDELDTSRSIIILTSNRPDLVDDAIRDRFLTYTIGYPDAETLVEMVEQLKPLQELAPAQRIELRDDLLAAVKAGTIRSMREAQRFAVRKFVAKLLARDSLAQRYED